MPEEFEDFSQTLLTLWIESGLAEPTLRPAAFLGVRSQSFQVVQIASLAAIHCRMKLQGNLPGASYVADAQARTVKSLL